MQLSSRQILVGSSIPLVIAICWFDLIGIIVRILLLVALTIIGLVILLLVYSNSGTRQRNDTPERSPKFAEFRDHLRKRCMTEEDAERRELSRYSLIISRSVDGVLQNLLDLIFRDFVSSWLKDLVISDKELIDSLKLDVWLGIQRIHERAVKIDQTNLIACKIVNKLTGHLEKIRLFESWKENEDIFKTRRFAFSPHVEAIDKEVEYLREIFEIFIVHFMPQGYRYAPVKPFLTEIFIYKVIKPAIDIVTDPDYINQKVLSYIEKQQLTEAMQSFACEYADSFDDFITMIKSTRDLEILKQVRTNVIGEITQAAAQNMQQQLQIDEGFENGDSSLLKKNKRYMKQLKFVKRICERHMRTLGWNGYPVNEDDVIDALSTLDNKVLPMQAVLENPAGREILTQFFEQESTRDLIKFWTAVRDLKTSDKSSWHQLGAEIYYTHVRSPAAEIRIDKDVKKRIENFLLGDSGPEVLFEIQEKVVKTLEDKYYPSFLVSEHYKKLLDIMDVEFENDILDEKKPFNGTSIPEENDLSVGEHSSCARGRLYQIQEKLSNKMQALEAMSISVKPESKVINLLTREVEWLQGEKRRLEAHLKHTEMWTEHLGRWRAEVQSADTPENGEAPEFVLVIHIVEDDTDDTSVSTGWVVLRKLFEFHELHRKLRQLCPDVRSLELPSQPLKFFGKVDKNSSDKAKVQIQRYLNFVLMDERLNQSEALYAFLSPSSEHLKHSPVSPKKSRFSLATFFKSTSTNSSSSGDSRERDDDECSLLLEETENKTFIDGGFGPSKDAIAEPIYALLEEIFDLKGVLRWLRRSLITFVQLSYGRTISRQIRDSVAYIFSETMLHYYIQLLTKSWWPNGQLVFEASNRTAEEKLKTKEIARAQFLNSIPDVLINLVGAESAQQGFSKIFDALQNEKMNKQLFYDVLDVAMCEMFPDLERFN